MADPIANPAPPAVSPDRPLQPPAPSAAGATTPAAPDVLSPEDAHKRMIDRIEDALTRIDIATRRRADALTTLEQRHDVLRDRMTQAIATLDTVLAAADAADTAEAPSDAAERGDA
ncbi:hypothetical protein [Sphingomonas sp. CARO-RG-8B-R24-01]|uniref:hypothetical protein n=1 Tax=Sphingomonas sp. CARO-RG-8B-R24-01 TaxID=2914831 RepID=UPI001F585D1A|nr:hypothetical protein [Sphingomonas sp. CARO-RG-8B-R24-01]